MKARTILTRSTLLAAGPLAVFAALAAASPAGAQMHQRTLPPPLKAAPADSSARAILERYASAWRGREEMPLQEDTVVIGFRISGETGGDFHVVLPPEGAGAVRDGAAPADAVVFEADIATIRRLDRGELSALTAMGQARASDPVPLVPRFPEGFRWTPEARAFYLPFAFHFWNREWPEVVRFGQGTTRVVHGGNAAVLYYDRGLRTAWYQLEPGMHINADPADQANPFPTLVIVTRGSFQARLGGQDRTLREGEALLIPAGMTHEFLAGPDQYGEFVVIMFGEGA